MTKKPLKSKEITYKGQSVRLYNTRQTALLVKKSKKTLSRWRKEGILPAPFFWKTLPCNLKTSGRETVRKEYLTQQELNMLIYLLDKYDVFSTKPVPAAFTEEITKEWKAIHARFEAGVSELGPAKFVWRFESRESAAAVLRDALGLATVSKALQYVDVINSSYDKFLGKGV